MPNQILSDHGLLAIDIESVTKHLEELGFVDGVSIGTSAQVPIQGTEGIMAYVYPMPRNVDTNDLKNYQDLSLGYDVLSYSSSAGNPYWILYNDVNTIRRPGDKSKRLFV